ncbi:hypothetical protein FOL47_004950 [Perkinsus chesapeaki]|uniref:Uncharacterized protein n=1 Tax=Perkinsus chesapeaki TaxID=330153 RepID=A0A7J6MYS4_PERCH|nr:hypothetical protein FOL47_004950 [Perkinsus chesapeaki]
MIAGKVLPSPQDPMALKGTSLSAMAEACFFTYKLDYSICESNDDTCYQITISAADVQRQMTRFYHSPSRSSPPPLDLVGLLAMFDHDWISVFARECPPMMMVVALITLEIYSSIGEPAVALQAVMPRLRIVLESGFNLTNPTDHQPSLFEVRRVLEAAMASPAWHHWKLTWPLEVALDHAIAELNKANEPKRKLNVDIIVAWCREELAWLDQLVGLIPEGGINVEEASADYSMFLQGDAPNHSPQGLLRLLMESIASGSFSLHFLHLGNARGCNSILVSKALVYNGPCLHLLCKAHGAKLFRVPDKCPVCGQGNARVRIVSIQGGAQPRKPVDGAGNFQSSGVIGLSPSEIIDAWQGYLIFLLQQKVIGGQKTMVKKKLVQEKAQSLKARYPEVVLPLPPCRFGGYKIFYQLILHGDLKQRYDELVKTYMETRTQYRDTLSRIQTAKRQVAQAREVQDAMEGICRQSEITTRASTTPKTILRGASCLGELTGFRAVSGAQISVTGKRRTPF